MRRVMTIVGVIGMAMIAIGILGSLLIDIPKAFIVVGMILASTFELYIYVTDVLRLERKNNLRLRKQRRRMSSI